MLGKLFKYDFKSMIRFWWIAALAVTGLSVVGGFAFTAINSDKNLPGSVYVVLYMVLMLIYFAFIAFGILSVVSIFVRFYKNFFSDEGYLTFTLPVKKTHLLNSKILSATLLEIITGAVIYANIFIIICITFAKDIFTTQFINEFIDGITEIFAEATVSDIVYLVVWFIEICAILLLSSLFSLLLLYLCITLGSIITKKARVVVAIAIYYGVVNVLTFIIYILLLFGIESAVIWISDIPEAVGPLILTLIFFAIILLMSAICMLMYTLEYRMLDKKLNLS
ncbi:MAG: hypothetical protein E7384_01205 [Ruminococcaceae bacterium]|nr:hypothetical protein [Oscillospiraceae bacterium]